VCVCVLISLVFAKLSLQQGILGPKRMLLLLRLRRLPLNCWSSLTKWAITLEWITIDTMLLAQMDRTTAMARRISVTLASNQVIT
jgi:hypothetical protein